MKARFLALLNIQTNIINFKEDDLDSRFFTNPQFASCDFEFYEILDIFSVILLFDNGQQHITMNQRLNLLSLK